MGEDGSRRATNFIAASKDTIRRSKCVTLFSAEAISCSYHSETKDSLFVLPFLESLYSSFNWRQTDSYSRHNINSSYKADNRTQQDKIGLPNAISCIIELTRSIASLSGRSRLTILQ